MSEPSAGTPTVIRPSKGAYLMTVIGSTAAMLPIAIPLLLNSLRNPGTLIALPIVLVIGLGGVSLMFLNTRVAIAEGGVLYTGWWGRRRSIRMTAVGTVVRADKFAVNWSLENCQLFVLDHGGRRLFRMRGEFWERKDQVAVSSALNAAGVTRVILHEPVKPSEVRARYPRTVGFWEAHPYWFSLIVFVVFGIALFLVIELIDYLAAG